MRLTGSPSLSHLTGSLSRRSRSSHTGSRLSRRRIGRMDSSLRRGPMDNRSLNSLNSRRMDSRRTSSRLTGSRKSPSLRYILTKNYHRIKCMQ